MLIINCCFGSYNYIVLQTAKVLEPIFLAARCFFFRLATMFTSTLNISVSPILQVNSSFFRCIFTTQNRWKEEDHFEKHFLGSNVLLLLFRGPAILQERQEESFIRVPLKLTTKIKQVQVLKTEKQQLLVFRDSFQRDSQVNLHLAVLVLFKRNPYHIFPWQLILKKIMSEPGQQDVCVKARVNMFVDPVN